MPVPPFSKSSFLHSPLQIGPQNPTPAGNQGFAKRSIEAKTALPPAELSQWVPVWEDPQAISIFCEPFDDKQPQPPEAFEKALRAWQSASNGGIQFKPLTRHNDTSEGIFIAWSDDTNPQRPYEVGRTLNQTHFKKGQLFIYRSDLVLQRNPRINQHLDSEAQCLQLYATFLHEIGHALGLEHTQNPHSVMFYRSLQNHQFTHEDLAQLQRLYGRPL